jgi:hypothetical protein
MQNIRNNIRQPQAKLRELPKVAPTPKRSKAAVLKPRLMCRPRCMHAHPKLRGNNSTQAGDQCCLFDAPYELSKLPHLENASCKHMLAAHDERTLPYTNPNQKTLTDTSSNLRYSLSPPARRHITPMPHRQINIFMRGPHTIQQTLASHIRSAGRFGPMHSRAHLSNMQLTKRQQPPQRSKKVGVPLLLEPYWLVVGCLGPFCTMYRTTG